CTSFIATSAIIRPRRVLRQMKFPSILHINPVTAFPYRLTFSSLPLRETKIIEEYLRMSNACRDFLLGGIKTAARHAVR
ncbi:hypothetical protein, partial [Janthinobacterium agaricidamnosum]|uniref:hypothetical protein n=1 Tax=Janthinobacterium agaricidamnosum TaxID=55508 RepID=UPI001C3F45BB